jgi:hypothetical protein
MRRVFRTFLVMVGVLAFSAAGGMSVWAAPSGPAPDQGSIQAQAEVPDVTASQAGTAVVEPASSHPGIEPVVDCLPGRTEPAAASGAAGAGIDGVASSLSAALSCSVARVQHDRAEGKTTPSAARPNMVGYQLSGTVHGAVAGIAGAYVDVYDGRGMYYDSAQADVNGAWTMTVPPGNYYLAITDYTFTYAMGWYSAAYPSYYPGCAGFTPLGYEASRVLVTDAGVSGIDTWLPQAVELDGQVSYPVANGMDFTALEIDFYLNGFFYGYVTGYAGGSYAAMLAPGSYRAYLEYSEPSGVSTTPGIWYKAGTFTYDYSQASPMTTGAGAVDIAYPRMTKLGGTIDNPSGNVTVEACNGTTCSWQDGAVGSFYVTALPGDYQIYFWDFYGSRLPGWYSTTGLQAGRSAATTINVASQAEITGLNVTLGAGSPISGTVDPGGSNQSMTVDAYLDGTFYNSTTSAAFGGSYTIPVAPGHSYQLFFSDPNDVYQAGWYTASGPTIDYSSADPVAAGSTGVNITLPATPHISGTISGADGAPLAGVCIGVWSGSTLDYYAITDADGSYVTGVEPGSYAISVNMTDFYPCSYSDWTWYGHTSSRSGGVYGQGWYSDAGFVFEADAGSAGIVNVGGDVTGLNLVLPTVPGRPAGLSATVSGTSATLTWTAASSANGSPITGYVATALSAGAPFATCTTAGATTCTITGLTEGVTSYVVQAINRVGTGLPSSAYLPGSTYHALNPTRVLDTRIGMGLSGALVSHKARTFKVTGAAVPWNATAVTGNLTVTQQGSAGFLYVGPSPMDNPTSSTLNFPMGDDRANGVTVALGPGGVLSVTFAAPTLGPTAHAIFDVTGYFTTDATGATYVPLPPARLLDSRYGTGLYGVFSSHVARTFQVTGFGGVPAGATAVTGNLTVTQQSAIGFLYVGPTAANNPSSSTLNFPRNDDRANNVTVALGPGGTLSVTYAAPTLGPTAHVIFDVTGYFFPGQLGAKYFAMTPTRLLDSRYGTGLAGAFYSHIARGFVVAKGSVPTDAVAVTGNLTVTQQAMLGFLYIGPTAMNDPTSSTLNFPFADDRANGVTVALGSGGLLYVTYAAPILGPPAQVIFDVTGYFEP